TSLQIRSPAPIWQKEKFEGKGAIKVTARRITTRVRGFTLIEILVAVTILAILAVAAYGGLNALIKSREITKTHAQHFKQLQLAMATIERDLEQTSARPIRLA